MYSQLRNSHVPGTAWSHCSQQKAALEKAIRDQGHELRQSQGKKLTKLNGKVMPDQVYRVHAVCIAESGWQMRLTEHNRAQKQKQVYYKHVLWLMCHR